MTVAIRQAGAPQGLILVAQAVLPTMGAVLLVPVLPLLFAEYGEIPHAEYWIPALLTVPGLCIALLSPAFGWLTDRIGRRRVLIGALLFYGLAGMAPAALTSFAAVFASRVVLGICDAAVITVSAVMIGDYYEGVLRAKWLALISVVASLSAAVFLGAAGLLGAEFGWRGAVMVYGLALLFVPAMLLFTWEPAAVTVSKDAPPGRGLAPHLWLTGACTLFGAVLFYTLVLQQGVGLAALGTLDPARIGLLTAIASLGNPIGSLVFRRLTQWPTTVLLGLAFFVIAAGLVAAGQTSSDIGFTAAVFIGMFGAGLLLPTLLTWTMRPLPFATRGRGTAVFQSSFAAGQFGSTLALPFLTARVTNSILASFAVLGLLALVAAIVIAGVRLTKSDRL